MKPAFLADGAAAAEGSIAQRIARREAAKYRPDIDGLRAVAIGTVFVFHANHDYLPGGFIGVDCWLRGYCDGRPSGAI